MKNSTLRKVAFILNILEIVGCVVAAVIALIGGLTGSVVVAEEASISLAGLGAIGAIAYLIPLAWVIPMTVKVAKEGPLGTGFKVCTLLFVNLISGILLLCDKNN